MATVYIHWVTMETGHMTGDLHGCYGNCLYLYGCYGNCLHLHDYYGYCAYLHGYYADVYIYMVTMKTVYIYMVTMQMFNIFTWLLWQLTNHVTGGLYHGRKSLHRIQKLSPLHYSSSY